PAPLDHRREAVLVALRAGRLRPGLSLQSRWLIGAARGPGRVGWIRCGWSGRAVQGAVLHRCDGRAARPAAAPDRSRRQEPDADFDGAGDARRAVRSDVPAVRRHLFPGRHTSGRNAAPRRRHAGPISGRQPGTGAQGGRVAASPAGVSQGPDARRRVAQRLDHQAPGFRPGEALPAAVVRVRRARLPDRHGRVGGRTIPVASDVRPGRVSGGKRGQSRDRRARGEVHETDLPAPRPVRIGRSNRGGTLVRPAAICQRGSDRDLGVELRRVHDVTHRVSGRRVVQGRARRRARHGLALLRYDLHRALHAHASGEPDGLRRERIPHVHRQPQEQLPPGARHRRRQRALPEQRAPGAAARGGEQAVRHADLPEQDPLDRRWHHPGKPVRALHVVAEGPPVGPEFARLGRRALAVLTLINLFNYLDRWIVAALAESMKHSELQLSDTQLGSLMTGFIIVYMVAAPLFGSLGDARSRTRLLSLGVALWSGATALAVRLYDPPRGAQDSAGGVTPGAHAVSLGGAARAAYAALVRNRPYVLTVLGYAAYTFAIGALAFWTPAFLERTRGIPQARA